MSYTASLLNRRIAIARRMAQQEASPFGRGATAERWYIAQRIWASITFSRGTKSLREGALDAYEVLLVRCHYHALLSRDCRLVIKDKVYEIQSYNEDQQANEVQLTCVELTGAKVPSDYGTGDN